MGVRVEKLQEEIKHAVGNILLRDMHNPHLGFVTVTSVKLTPDLRHARIYISVLGSKSQVEDSWEALKKSQAYIRHSLAQKVRMRYVPEIELFPDTTMQYSAHIQGIINKIHRDEGNK